MQYDWPTRKQKLLRHRNRFLARVRRRYFRRNQWPRKYVCVRKLAKGVFTWENSLRRELHTGMTSWFRITFTWWLGHFIIPRPTCWSWRNHLGLTKIMHALPVPVYLQTDFTPKRVVVSCLHDTVTKSRTGVKFSPVARTGVNSRRGDSRRHDILWQYHVNKCRATAGNRS